MIGPESQRCLRLVYSANKMQRGHRFPRANEVAVLAGVIPHTKNPRRNIHHRAPSCKNQDTDANTAVESKAASARRESWIQQKCGNRGDKMRKNASIFITASAGGGLKETAARVDAVRSSEVRGAALFQKRTLINLL